MENRRPLSLSKLRRILQTKISSRNKLNMDKLTVQFTLLSYYYYMKKLGKVAKIAAVSDRKQAISKEHLIEAHKTILQSTQVQRKQRTLDNMLAK